MARRGATARVNLVKASTGSAAPLVTAKTGARQIAASPLVHAPTPTAQRTSPSLPAPVQVGGEKAAHQGFETQTATVGGTDLSLVQLRNGSYELRDPNGNVRRKYSSGQMAGVTRRGNSGATMDPLDQAAFFRIGGGKTADEKAEEKRQQIRQEKNEDQIAAEKRNNEEWTRRNDIQQQQQIEAEKRSQTQWQERQDAILKQKQDEEARIKQQAEDENNAFNSKYGIDEGTHLSQKDKDDIAAGRSRWGYSAQDQQAIDKINDDIKKDLADGYYNTKDKLFYVGDDGKTHMVHQGDTGFHGQETFTEYDAVRRQADEEIASYKKGVQKNTEERTPEQIYNGAFEINGVKYYSPDGKSLVPIDEGQRNKAAQEARAQERADNQAYRKEEREIAAQNRRQERIDKYEQSIIDNLMKPVGEGDEATPGMSYEEALAEARKRSAAFFAQPTAQPTPAPAAQPTTTSSASNWQNNPLFK